MKVAIYGDSFADPLVGNLELTANGVNVAWPDIIKQKYNVDVFARGGTSPFYSYEKFKETHENYDKVIFLVTDSRRWGSLFEVKGRPNQYNDNLHSFGNIAIVDEFLTNPESRKYLTTELNDKLEALKLYYMYLSDDADPVNKLLSCLMIDDIIRMRNDVIMLPGFDFGETHSIQNKTSLATFAYIWLNNWPEFRKQVHGYNYLHWREKRTLCHFSKEVNEIIAKNMLDALDKGQWDPEIPDFIKAEHENFDYYYYV